MTFRAQFPSHTSLVTECCGGSALSIRPQSCEHFLPSPWQQPSPALGHPFCPGVLVQGLGQLERWDPERWRGAQSAHRAPIRVLIQCVSWSKALSHSRILEVLISTQRAFAGSLVLLGLRLTSPLV